MLVLVYQESNTHQVVKILNPGLPPPYYLPKYPILQSIVLHATYLPTYLPTYLCTYADLCVRHFFFPVQRESKYILERTTSSLEAHHLLQRSLSLSLTHSFPPSTYLTIHPIIILSLSLTLTHNLNHTHTSSLSL